MQKNYFYRPTYPIFFRTVTGNKQFLFLGLTVETRKTFEEEMFNRTQPKTDWFNPSNAEATFAQSTRM